jgi:carbamoyltransferase
VPGFPIPDWLNSSDPKNSIKNSVVRFLQKDMGYQHSQISRIKENFDWVKHHDGHLGSGMGVTTDEPTLVLSIDGEGDWESGAVALSINRVLKVRKSIASHLDSLGHLYSEVTKAYGFKPSRHEGKITGLAAYGKFSNAAEILMRAVRVKNGTIELRYVKNNDLAKITSKLRSVGLAKKVFTSLEDIVSQARDSSLIYPDLAFAIQYVLEESVCEIVRFWTSNFGVRNVSLCGGVFANVKLNQKVSEIEGLGKVAVFPNMGDGGLSLGGIWHQLSVEGRLGQKLFENMYLSEDYFIRNLGEVDLRGIEFSPLNSGEISVTVAKALARGLVVGLHVGGVEFGPRALGNRSILFDANRVDLGEKLNKKLKRTEFMPFAPVVLESHFHDYFEWSKSSLDVFQFMTMTCNVLPESQARISAVTHVDGTARPQVVPRDSNSMLKNILQRFLELTGKPILVNTSLNMHEEPINGKLNDSLNCLRMSAIDLLATEHGIYCLADSKDSNSE